MRCWAIARPRWRASSPSCSRRCGGSRLSALIAHYEQAGAPKGEIVIVVGPPEEERASEQDVDALLRQALERMSVKDAAATVAAATGAPKRTVYARALELQGEK